MKLLITDFDLGKSSFQNDYRSLPADIKESFKERFKMLLDEPKPKKLRLEKLSGYKRPGIIQSISHPITAISSALN